MKKLLFEKILFPELASELKTLLYDAPPEICRFPSANGSVRMFRLSSGREIILKEYHRPHWKPTPAIGIREGRNFARVSRLGIPTVTPLAYGEERDAFHSIRSFLFTEYQKGCLSGKQFLAAHADPGEVKLYETFLFRNMDLLARMHSNSLVHNDFHLYNLLAKSDGEQLEIYWLDFSGVKNFSKLRPSRCYRDLAVFLRSGGFAPALREKLLQHYHFCRMRYTVGETPPIQYLPLHRAAFSGSSC